MTRPVVALISGGQSGVDRAALDVAVALGLDYGGHVPSGGWAEDFPEPPGVLAAYPKLVEMARADPDVRTVHNVRDSDATLVVTGEDCPSPGTNRAIRAALDLGKPCLVTNGTDADELARWLQTLGAHVRLNVAGPRRSEWPPGYDACRDLLEAVLG
jgi:hypothetical protein